MQRKLGFTLIELLVTITIISLLTSIIYVSFGDARVNARNKAMAVDLKEVQLVIETYRGQHDAFPLPAGTPCGGIADGDLIASDSGCSVPYITGLVPEFIDALPSASDSANDLCDIVYQTDTDGSWYKLTAINCVAGVDAVSGVSPNEPLARCAPSCAQGTSGDTCFPTEPAYYESLAVYSLGGQCE